MIVEVVNTGTELLLGEVLNTHAAWFGKQLFPCGLRISRQVTVPDGPVIRDVLIESFHRADILLVTGGLGPTADDVTREIIAELLGLQLIPNDSVREQIESYIAARGGIFREGMLRQTLVPEGATVLPNEYGTAPGLYLPAVEYPSSRFPALFLFPGPPRELQPMFSRHAMPILREIAGGLPASECRIYRTVGLGESAIEDLIGSKISTTLQLEVGYCARPNEVDLRLIGVSSSLEKIEPAILQALGKHLVSRTGEKLEEWVVKRLRDIRRTIATAESCTGGLLAHRLTNVPGASEVFRHGFVTYANEAKVLDLGVDSKLILQHGAVSDAVAVAMAEKALEKAQADYSLALTGIAGPDGGTAEKPVGTVFIALGQRNEKTIFQKCRFLADRETFKQLATQAALDMLRRELLN